MQKQKGGVKFLPDRNSSLKIRELLKKNESVAMIFDQHVAGRHGIRVPFFNRPASTMKSVALLHQKTNCTVISAFSYRENKKHHIVVGEEIPLLRRQYPLTLNSGFGFIEDGKHDDLQNQ